MDDLKAASKPADFSQVLGFAEERLLAIAPRLDVPIEPLGQDRTIVLGIVRQAFDVYLATLRECAREGIPSALVLARVVLEAAILSRWLEGALALRVEMYLAEDDRDRLNLAKVWPEFRARRGFPPGDPAFSDDEDREMRVKINRVRAKARTADEQLRKSGSVLPNVEQMAHAIGDNATWEAYQILYRTLSPWTHTGGRALAGHEVAQRPAGLHLVPGSTWTGEMIRSIAAPSAALLLAVGSRMAGAGFEGECDLIQNSLALWPASEAAG